MDIGEIARRAGVARSTVSYALSGKRPVSVETRRRIQQVIDELDYRPNASARALKEGRTRTVGLVIPPAGPRLTSMQLDFVGSVVEAAARVDLDVLLSPSGGDRDRSLERLISGRRVDGVILMEILMEDSRVARVAQSGVPFVTIGRVRDPDATWWVDMDYAALVGRCVDHLADLGHRHVALVNRSPALMAAGYSPGHRARDGFAEAVARRGVSGSEFCCEDDVAGGERCVAEILATRPSTTAIVTVNEAALPGVQRALERAGHEIPRTFSVAGIAAHQWAEEFHPPLTAADVPSLAMGTVAVELLAEHIADPDAPAGHRLFMPPISLRDSTGSVPRPSARPAFFSPAAPRRFREADAD
ncbi:transcriptional regulator, LacI family [Catenulispora acidiphila DSM 44928]|uniref:Transcriptional regulator, LacI family n=1 Tax=Catenulispora acidiphila (strain DSM 44928 / JCM 14897 / NBRC 102108 / NRRL B-24433 / ID139908) TaxID=479433 RepID=C7QAK6_CATAD|nr:LacI family DNA-binding transcriptional regulator [Catenulispora acidiphila]ACU72505.1 transcriptional regulator, LacI family [Catenulispora acidiphila DSM 44928]